MKVNRIGEAEKPLLLPEAPTEGKAALDATRSALDPSSPGDIAVIEGLPQSHQILSGNAPKKRLLTASEEISLARRIKNNDREARQRMIESNMALVFSIVNHFRNPNGDNDLAQAGMVGLIKAVDGYGEEVEGRFSSYAVPAITREILKTLRDEFHQVKIPPDAFERLRIIKRAKQDFIKKNDQPPTVQQLANMVNMRADTVLGVLRFTGVWLMSLDQMVNKNTDPYTDPQEANNGDSPVTIGESVVGQEDIGEKCMESEMTANVMEILQKTIPNDRNRNILIDRLGLNGRDPMTLDKVGEKYGIHRSRVQQIEVATLNKLRRSDYIKDLTDKRSDLIILE